MPHRLSLVTEFPGGKLTGHCPASGAAPRFQPPARQHVGTQIRAEAFNVANTPHSGVPNLSFGREQFGVVNDMQNQSRVLQLALKFMM